MLAGARSYSARTKTSTYQPLYIVVFGCPPRWLTKGQAGQVSALAGVVRHLSEARRQRFKVSFGATGQLLPE